MPRDRFKVNAEPDKCDDLRWFGVDALPPITIGYVREAIAHARRGVAYATYWDRGD